jgi:nucleoside-diphosphate-sugar epimerase
MKPDESAPVLVTGAAGYIASWLVKDLLEDGRLVHATVRDPDKAKGLEHLRKLGEEHGARLQLFKADLLKPGTFDTAMAGCQLVFHTASPFIVSKTADPEASLVRPALEGTKNVLDSVERTASVKRVVLTSSVVALYGDSVDIAGKQCDEQSWNTTSTASHQPYPYSKTVAERAAWEAHDKQSRWELVTVNPAFVFGPALAKASDSASVDTMKQFADGSLKRVPELAFGVVDVRDVARAHIQAGYGDAVKGRYLLTHREMTFLEMGAVLRAKFGSAYPFPRSRVPKWMAWLVAPMVGLTRKFVSQNVGYPISLDNSRSIRELGVTYRPTEDSLVEHFQQLLDDGIVERRGQHALP